MANPVLAMVAPMTADAAQRWSPPFEATLAEISGSSVVDSALQAWSIEDPPGRSDRVQNAFWHALAPWELVDGIAREFGREGAGVEVLTAAKVVPMAVVLTGLGGERSQALPGVAGQFLLTPDGLAAAAPAIRRAFELNDAERTAVLRRMAAVLADAYDHDIAPAELLDVVPRVCAAAAADGQGVVCVSGVVG